MTVWPAVATEEQGSFLRALHDALESHPGLDREAALAVASNFVGRLVALLPPRLSSEDAHRIIAMNVGQGNREAVQCCLLFRETAGHA